MRVPVEVEETELDGDHGGPVPGVLVTCSRCRHQVEVFGTGDSSVRRGCVMLRDECAEGGWNFYVPPDEYVDAVAAR